MPLVTFGQDDQLGEMVIDNPPLNLFNADMLSDLRSAVEQAAHSDIRAVLMRAEGNDFSAGADVSVFTGLLINRVVPADRRIDEGRAFAKTLANCFGVLTAESFELVNGPPGEVLVDPPRKTAMLLEF
jgi:enoyl-CoA hydratase/carnithine racemase